MVGDQSPRQAAQEIADYDAEHKSNNPSPNRDEESSGGDNSNSNGGSSGGNGSNSNSPKKAEELKSGSVANTFKAVTVSAAIPGTLQADLVAGAIANKGIPKATATKVTTSTNLTSKNITNWKQRVDRAISRDLLTSLKKSYDDVVQMAKITSSQDDNALSSNLKGLSNVIDEAYQKLSTFIRYFDTDLTTYINTMEKAEKTASENVKATTDAFSEAASKIASLKM